MAAMWYNLIGRSTLIELLTSNGQGDFQTKKTKKMLGKIIKILEQIKGGGFLAGDLPMSTSSTTLIRPYIIILNMLMPAYQ